MQLFFVCNKMNKVAINTCIHNWSDHVQLHIVKSLSPAPFANRSVSDQV